MIHTTIKTLVRGEGEAFTSIEAEFDDKGNLKISGQDIDEGMKSWFGSDEFEYFLTIPKDEVENFTLEVLKKTFNQTKPLGYYDLRDICKDKDIKHYHDWWA